MVKGQIPDDGDRLLDRPDVAVDERRGYLYRPGEILVAREHVDRVDERLREEGGRPEETRSPRILRYRFPPRVDIPELVDDIRGDGERGEYRDDRPPVVGPNHILIGEPYYKGNPADDAVPDREVLTAPGGDGEGVLVGVLDTGLAKHEYLAQHVSGLGPEDAEEFDDDGDGALDPQSGHGTFVSGLVRSQAPAAKIRLRQVLDSHGVGDELRVSIAIEELAKCHILNLSLGGYTHGDLAPLGIAAALEALPPATVVVAAAGNNAHDRPFWPATFKRVIAVGALDEAKEDGGGRAWFSNYGWWVDACAPGVRMLSSFVRWDGPTEPQRDFSPGRVKPVVRYEGWARWSGTSFAAPLVTGAIAAKATGASAADAAAELVRDPGLPRVPDLGAVVPLPHPPV